MIKPRRRITSDKMHHSITDENIRNTDFSVLQLRVGQKLKNEYYRHEVTVFDPVSELTETLPNIVARVTNVWGDATQRWLEVRRRIPKSNLASYTEEVLVPRMRTPDPDTTLTERREDILPPNFTMGRRR